MSSDKSTSSSDMDPASSSSGTGNCCEEQTPNFCLSFPLSGIVSHFPSTPVTDSGDDADDSLESSDDETSSSESEPSWRVYNFADISSNVCDEDPELINNLQEFAIHSASATFDFDDNTSYSDFVSGLLSLSQSQCQSPDQYRLTSSFIEEESASASPPTMAVPLQDSVAAFIDIAAISPLQDSLTGSTDIVMADSSAAEKD